MQSAQQSSGGSDEDGLAADFLAYAEMVDSFRTKGKNALCSGRVWYLICHNSDLKF